MRISQERHFYRVNGVFFSRIYRSRAGRGMPAAMDILVIIKSPIDMKKTILATVLFLLARLAAAAAVDLGSTTEHTPYDRYLTPVKDVFNSMHGEGATMQKVQAAMRQGRAF